MAQGPASNELQSISEFWDRSGLGTSILDALRATGAALDRLTIDDLAPFDQFHGGGKAATMHLAQQRAGLAPGLRVLDVGGGLGGPARTLAVEFGCSVTVLDLAPSYVQAGRELSARLGLSDRVAHCVGSALALPFGDTSFDVIWTQNSGMNIAAKETMLAEFRRVLRPGGRYLFQEPMAGPLQPPHHPLMWAFEPGMSFLRPPGEMRTLTESAGLRVQLWEEMPPEAFGRPAAHGQSLQALVMGDRLAAIADAARRNREERRIVMVQGVCRRD